MLHVSRVDPPSVVNIADLRAIAKKRLPRVVFDYIDGGAGAEWTMRENARVFDDVMFRPRSAVATASVDLRTTVLGETIDLPFLLAPVGGRDVALAGIERAKTAGCSALVVTVDTPVAGMRERDVRNGTRELVSGAPFTMLPFIGQFLARPRWLAAFLRDGGLMRFANVLLQDGPMPYADVGPALEQSMVAWADFEG